MAENDSVQPSFEASKLEDNFSLHNTHLFDDPTEPYLPPPPLALFGTFSAHFIFIFLTLTISFFGINVMQHGDFHLASAFFAVLLLQAITVVGVEMHNEHLLRILYPVQLFFWTFSAGFFTYALTFSSGSHLYPPIYGYWITSILGIYQAFLVRGLSKYIELLNEQTVHLTGWQGIEANDQ